jgi:cytochrome-b5 reductase
VYQLIRAICEDESDDTQISLIYANNTEEDILLRQELDGFAIQCPEKFSVQYVLAKPPQGWAGESGFVTKEMIAKYLPTAATDSKVLLCGPPPMIEATKKNLASLNFSAPGSISKTGDQVFLF